MIRHPAAPPLIMFRVLTYHAVTGLGGCACDPDLALNLQHTSEVEHVPPGMRCTKPACVRQFREGP